MEGGDGRSGREGVRWVEGGHSSGRILKEEKTKTKHRSETRVLYIQTEIRSKALWVTETQGGSEIQNGATGLSGLSFVRQDVSVSSSSLRSAASVPSSDLSFRVSLLVSFASFRHPR